MALMDDAPRVTQLSLEDLSKFMATAVRTMIDTKSPSHPTPSTLRTMRLTNRVRTRPFAIAQRLYN